MNVDETRYRNPFEGLSLQETYEGLMAGRFGPTWPDTHLQAGYTGAHGPETLRRAFAFIQIMEQDGAFTPDWRGFDYGCGWGRFASTLLSKGSPQQLDLYDAWASTIRMISRFGYENRISLLPEVLAPGDIPESSYDMGFSFSVFTHLSPQTFENNLSVLVSAVKPGGTLYFTVRHAEFIDHKYRQARRKMGSALKRDGIVFVDSKGDLGTAKVFGDTVVTPEFVKSVVRGGEARYVGTPHPLQHVYAITRRA